MVPTVSFTTATMSMSKSCRRSKGLHHHKGKMGVKTEKDRDAPCKYATNPVHGHTWIEVGITPTPHPPILHLSLPIKTVVQTAARSHLLLHSRLMSICQHRNVSLSPDNEDSLWTPSSHPFTHPSALDSLPDQIHHISALHTTGLEPLSP